jgi:Holliday junction resolvase RusA-like endonuclease
MPDNRRTDLSNKAESIMDLLVDNGILEDDCWQIVPILALQGMKVDKENPRAEIFITTVPIQI